MNRYTIYCTEQQTRKALELGAPIEGDMSTKLNHLFDEIPTAEQMLGWFEEQGIQVTIHVNAFDEWKTIVYAKSSAKTIAESEWSKSRKDAIIVAIDEALDYLSKEEQQ